ncbi:TrbI/VirB10 family protein [Nostoc sp.]|uniref:TrbI/VirB10 family protein n=1 Tax=Nostoc sp. TaxID=1180 RepID=UPI0035930986
MTDNNSSTINNLLKIDDESRDLTHKSEIGEEVELDSPVVTKHTVVTSPWSRLLVIALPFGLTFFAIFWMLNGVFNPTKQPTPIAEQTQKSSEALDKLEQKDGDVYAKLALSQQQDELSKINKDKSEKPQPSVIKTEKVVEKSPTSPRTQQPTTRVSYSPEPRHSFATTRVDNPTSTKVSARPLKPVDPSAEFNRLRNIGSYGKIIYADTSLRERKSLSPDRVFTQEKQVKQSNNLNINGEPIVTEISQNNTPSSIEKISPRWQVETKINKPVALANSYLSQESQILQERKTRYLTVGEFASGVLVTPAVKQQTDTRNDRQQTSHGRRFVAKLTEDLHDNNGDVAIPSGSLLAVEVVSVDGGSYAQVQVTSIIKDKTEYPISIGAISVHGEGAKPLIAKKFQNKGGEIAQYDLTVGLIGGLGKVGEIINQPDSQSSIQNSSIGSFSSSVTQNSRRNITGAFLEGAFGNLTDIVGNRAERSTQEILARPNVWYIPQGTKVTFLVNRTLELP